MVDGADFWQAVTPPVPDWRSGAPPSALQWLRKHLRTDSAAPGGGDGGLVGSAVTARLFRERKAGPRPAEKHGTGERRCHAFRVWG